MNVEISKFFKNNKNHKHKLVKFQVKQAIYKDNIISLYALPSYNLQTKHVYITPTGLGSSTFYWQCQK